MHNIHRTLNYIERKKKQKQIIKQVLCGAYLNNGNSSKNQEKIVICQHLKYIGQIGCLTHKQLIKKKKKTYKNKDKEAATLLLLFIERKMKIILL